MIKENKGFTLIELLVVVAIIGILSGIAFVSISGARQSAYDTQIRSELSQIRSNAEQWYYDAGGEYTGYEGSPGWTGIQDRIPPCSRAILGDTGAVTGTTTIGETTSYQLHVGPQAYAAWAPLCGDEDEDENPVYYCVDSTGLAERFRSGVTGQTYDSDTSCVEVFGENNVYQAGGATATP